MCPGSSAEPTGRHRFAIRVKPGASRDRVGGTWGDDVLDVAVTAKATDGKANAAVIDLLAGALGLRKSQLTIVQGATHRTKLIEVADPPPDLPRLVARLRSGT